MIFFYNYSSLIKKKISLYVFFIDIKVKSNMKKFIIPFYKVILLYMEFY